MEMKNYICFEDLEAFIMSKKNDNESINDLINECREFVKKNGFKAYPDTDIYEHNSRTKNGLYNGTTKGSSDS